MTRRCKHPGGCMKAPSFNVEGSKTGLYYATHAKDGMVKVSAKERAHADGCPTLPCWGDREDAAVPKYCAKHRGDLTGPNSISFTRACAPAGAEGCQRTCTWASRYGGQPTLCDIHGRLRDGDGYARIPRGSKKPLRFPPRARCRAPPEGGAGPAAGVESRGPALRYPAAQWRARQRKSRTARRGQGGTTREMMGTRRVGKLQRRGGLFDCRHARVSGKGGWLESGYHTVAPSSAVASYLSKAICRIDDLFGL